MEQVEEKKNLEIVWNDEKHLYQIAQDVEREVDEFINRCLCKEVSVINSNGEIEKELIPFEKIEDDETKKMVWKKQWNNQEE